MKLQKTAFLGILVVAGLMPAGAGVTVYEKGEKKIEIGGRIQVTYLGIDPNCSAGVNCLQDDEGQTFDSMVDSLFFRRLRLYIAGTITESWLGKIELDFGQTLNENEVQIRDAYFVFSGFKNDTSRLYIGNSKAVFGREFLNSSAALDLVERGFVGDHNFGVPDRMLGLRFDSRVAGGKLSYQLNAGSEAHDPAVARMDFESVVNNEGDFNEGWMASGRIDYHPMGYMTMSQADFTRSKSRFTVGLSGFGWRNDDDNNTYTDIDGTSLDPDKVDLSRAWGGELSLAYRGHGVSLDAEYQVVRGRTVVTDFTGGLYLNGATQLDKFGIVTGVMVLKNFLEIAAGYDVQDASNYETKYARTSLATNFYFAQKKHNLKLQLQYTMTRNFLGIDGQDQNVILASTQFKF